VSELASLWSVAILLAVLGLNFRNPFDTASQHFIVIRTAVAAQIMINPILLTAVSLCFDLSPQHRLASLFLAVAPGGQGSNILCIIARGEMVVSIVITSTTTALAVVTFPAFLRSGTAILDLDSSIHVDYLAPVMMTLVICVSFGLGFGLRQCVGIYWPHMLDPQGDIEQLDGGGDSSLGEGGSFEEGDDGASGPCRSRCDEGIMGATMEAPVSQEVQEVAYPDKKPIELQVQEGGREGQGEKEAHECGGGGGAPSTVEAEESHTCCAIDDEPVSLFGVVLRSGIIVAVMGVVIVLYAALFDPIKRNILWEVPRYNPPPPCEPPRATL